MNLGIVCGVGGGGPLREETVEGMSAGVMIVFRGSNWLGSKSMLSISISSSSSTSSILGRIERDMAIEQFVSVGEGCGFSELVYF